jgi:hypothetical protein
MTLPGNYDVSGANAPYTVTGRPAKHDQTARKALRHKDLRHVYVVKGCIRKRKQQQIVVSFLEDPKTSNRQV